MHKFLAKGKFIFGGEVQQRDQQVENRTVEEGLDGSQEEVERLSVGLENCEVDEVFEQIGVQIVANRILQNVKDLENHHPVLVVHEVDLHEGSDQGSEGAVADYHEEVSFVRNQTGYDQVDESKRKESGNSRDKVAVRQYRVGNDKVSLMIAVRKEQRR